MIIDIILIVVILSGALLGYKKGLAKILIKLIGFVLAILLAFIFKGQVANFLIENTEFETTINESIQQGLTVEINSSTEQNSFYTMVIDNLGVNEGIESLSNTITTFIFETIAFIIIVITVIIISLILQAVCDLVFSLPIIGSVNSIGGLIAGALLNVLRIFILFAILQVLSPTIPSIQKAIDGTSLTKELYYNNIVTDILSEQLNMN